MFGLNLCVPPRTLRLEKTRTQTKSKHSGNKPETLSVRQIFLILAEKKKMTAKEFIQSLPSRVAPEAVSGKNATFSFDLGGDGGGQYTVKVNDGKVEVAEGKPENHDCEVRGNATDFMKVIKGELNPMMALFTGKIKVSNQKALMEYAKVFGLSK